LLATGFFTFSLFGAVVNFVPILTDSGAAPMTAAGAASLVGIFSLIGRLTTGITLDRFPAHLVGAVCFLIPVPACALLLSNATVALNRADFGAGIDVEGTAAAAAVVLEQNTLILNNTAAQAGGGIRIAGNTRLYATEPQIWIGYNHADSGDGGGINVVGPARADIGSPGYNSIGVVSSNTAQYGGAVSLYAPSGSGSATIRVFSTDSNQPVQISGNSASNAGGAFILWGNEHDCGNAYCPDTANVCLYDARVNDNIAPSGAAFHAGVSDGVDSEYVYFNPAGNCGPESPVSLGAVACAAGVACDEISDNTNEDGSGNPTSGSTVEMPANGAHFYAERLHMRRNKGAHVFGSASPADDGADAEVMLSDCLIADNTLSGELLWLDSSDDRAVIDRCTIAGNSIGASSVLLLDGYQIKLTNSIIDQPGHTTLDFNGYSSNLIANYVLATEIFELGTQIGVMQGEPTFVDAANGDYHLAYGSLGIDFSPSGTGTDLDRKPRTVDMPLVNDLDGPMDLGAYELQKAPACIASDTIFCNGFEKEN
jgi:hypothetical protein